MRRSWIWFESWLPNAALPLLDIPEPEPFDGEPEPERLRGRRIRGWLPARVRKLGALPGRSAAIVARQIAARHLQAAK
jgi:hypothetical protein